MKLCNLISVAVLALASQAVWGTTLPDGAQYLGSVEVAVADFDGDGGWAEIGLGGATTAMLVSYGAVGDELVPTDSDFVSEASSFIVDVSRAVAIAQDADLETVTINIYQVGGEKSNLTLDLNRSAGYGFSGALDRGEEIEPSGENVEEREMVSLEKAVLASPNPFNPIVSFRIPNPESGYTLRIYDVSGALTHEVHAGIGSSRGVVRWDGRTRLGDRASSGTYLYRIENGDRVYTGKVTMLK